MWRDETSRIKAKLMWAVPHDELLKFAQDKKLMDAEYISFDQTISNDPASPTFFDVAGGVNVNQGEKLFDILRWETQVAGIAISMNYRGQALGHIEGNRFHGNFQVEYEAQIPRFPLFSLNMYGSGNFEVFLEID